MQKTKQFALKGISIALVIIASVASCFAVSPPARKVIPISNAKNVLEVNSASVEIFPERRVSVVDSGDDEFFRESVRTSGSTSIKKTDGVLVFNHAYQAYGYASGEIVFKFKPGQAPLTPLPSSLYPQFRRVGNTEMYAVNAGDPLELMSLYRKLAERADVLWVRPTIRYGND